MVWAVVDVETTGLYCKSVDRIIEIAIVRLDDVGHRIDAWVTLVDPNRDLGATSIHGITGRDMLGAPTFPDIADEVLWRLAGAVAVGHNLRFDLAFLTNEFGRLGLDFSPVRGVCTMDIAGRMGVGRSLIDCCASLGVPLADHHTALADAEATAGIFEEMLTVGGWQYPAPLPPWHRPAAPVSVRTRHDPPPSRAPTGTASLAQAVGIPQGSTLDHATAVAYLGVLDRVLEDRQLTPAEVTALADFASEWDISAVEAEQLHRAYIAETWKLAEADGIVTKAELRDIEILADLLGVPTAADHSVDDLVRHGRTVVDDWEGKSVCFTGETQCLVKGLRLQRADLIEYAEAAGMVVKTAVSGRLDLLVVADPDTRSGKAKKAEELGVAKMYDVAFLRALGLDCNAGSSEDGF